MELEPFGALNPLGLPDSVFSTKIAGPQPQITVCFRNTNRSLVDVHWINEERQAVRYGQLARGQFLKVKTYPKHPWVFREAGTGAPCKFSLYLRTAEGPKLSVPREVYWPQPFPAQVIALVDVIIVDSAKTLVDLCVAKIANTVRVNNTINNLPLPGNLLEAMLEDNFDEKIEALGPEAAITKFHEILKALVADKNTIILSRFVDAVNIFGYGKLRTVIKEQLPAVIQQLWKEELNDEACQVAQCLCYVLLIEKSYFDQDDSNTIWEAIFTKKTKSMAIEQSPIMALLTILLCGTSDDHWTSQLLESYDFPLEQMQDEAVATEYSHFESIIRDHKEVLLHVNPSTAVFLIKGLLKYYHTTLELEEYELIIDEYRRNKQLSTRPDLLEALDDPQLKVDHMEIEDKPIFEKDRIKLKFLIDVADNSPSKLGDIIKVLPHERIVNFLSKLPLKIKDNEKSCGLIVKYLLKKIREEDYELVRDVLMDIAELNSLPPSILSLCAEFVKVAGGKPIERDVVTLSLSMATTYDQKEFDAEAVMAMESLLHKCIFHAHCSITNDRVALYSQLLIHYIHALQRVLDDKETDETIKENMKYHCAQICYAITQHKLYFTRTVSFIISEILHSPMLGTYRLHEIADRPARALLAVALPPAPKRRYSKLLPIMKNARRFVA